MNEYQTIIQWLEKEPNIELVVPYIKEQIEAATLTEQEVNVLRDRIIMIKTHGHAKYLENDPTMVLEQVIPECVRVPGNCQARVK